MLQAATSEKKPRTVNCAGLCERKSAVLLNHFGDDGANAFAVAFHDIPGLDSCHAGWRAGHDQVTGAQLEDGLQVGNDFRNVPDQLCQIALLTHFTVDFEPNGTLAQVARLGRRRDVRHRR